MFKFSKNPVIIIASVFFRMKASHFSLLLFLVLGQHFLLLARLPHTMASLLENIFFLGVAGLVSAVIHTITLKLSMEINTLQTFLPICANCKKIRDDQGYWNQVESYISSLTDVKFTHGICPGCAETLYGHIAPDSSPDN